MLMIIMARLIRPKLSELIRIEEMPVVNHLQAGGSAAVAGILRMKW